MADEKVEFELVSPERLLSSETVDMVVVPGAEGDFGVLPRHSLLISGVRTGVIQVWNGNAVTDRIFVAGGFCEVTGERCTVLAEEAVRVEDIDRNAIEAELKNLREDAADAKSPEERTAAEARIATREAMLAAAG
ncbi:MAG: F0F1 ATP synthase subunit epsilon [Rhodospirillaceae bacterium]|nr:F0F1 ATP synthase subunit epsilon [Rhodospirillaceae bacterium]MDE0716891.1 F0F1 ATP synthase subunit epsilon [Rhodospirillaceae bacterium]MXY38946.1 F0F1 ATP synthase subunit epsilon [Rhodospirillaceae bacterium]MYH37532.1 F0F1 ATP synthase subunit epsilon [Rhodospirillaceae bacterium]MYK13879.1 F0F1 ATP synthase subunit epsilon [Rhodospirillaceae bacterium]